VAADWSVPDPSIVVIDFTITRSDDIRGTHTRRERRTYPPPEGETNWAYFEVGGRDALFDKNNFRKRFTVRIVWSFGSVTEDELELTAPPFTEGAAPGAGDLHSQSHRA